MTFEYNGARRAKFIAGVAFFINKHLPTLLGVQCGVEQISLSSVHLVNALRARLVGIRSHGVSYYQMFRTLVTTIFKAAAKTGRVFTGVVPVRVMDAILPQWS